MAHVLAYRWVYPQAHIRLSALLATGHGYMLGNSGFFPMLLGVGGALELVAFVWVVANTIGRRVHTPVPAWAFGLLPPVGFLLQEFLERWFAGVSAPWLIVLQPTVQIGLLLQVPFAIAAYLLTRLLLGVAARVGRALRGDAALPQIVGVVPEWVVRVAWSPRLAVLADGHAGRGPPLRCAC